MVCKFCEKAHFWAIRLKLCQNCAFPHNFHTIKLDEITVFYAVNGGYIEKFIQTDKYHFYSFQLLIYIGDRKILDF